MILETVLLRSLGGSALVLGHLENILDFENILNYENIFNFENILQEVTLICQARETVVLGEGEVEILTWLHFTR